jgi:hypothetical protein
VLQDIFGESGEVNTRRDKRIIPENATRAIDRCNSAIDNGARRDGMHILRVGRDGSVTQPHSRNGMRFLCFVPSFRESLLRFHAATASHHRHLHLITISSALLKIPHGPFKARYQTKPRQEDRDKAPLNFLGDCRSSNFCTPQRPSLSRTRNEARLER